MKHRTSSVLLMCALCIMAITGSGIARAAPPAAQAVAIPAAKRPLLLRTGQGCGWDYPCAPRPIRKPVSPAAGTGLYPQQLWSR